MVDRVLAAIELDLPGLSFGAVVIRISRPRRRCPSGQHRIVGIRPAEMAAEYQGYVPGEVAGFAEDGFSFGLEAAEFFRGKSCEEVLPVW